jgi:hypothetical protein
MRSINIYYWKTVLHLLLNEIKPQQHLLLSALEGPIGIASYRRKYRHFLSQFNRFLCSFNLFRLFEQTNFYVHFRASPLMVDNNHRVPLVELALLPSTPAKAPAGLRCSDCGRIETLQWIARTMGPGTLCVDCGRCRWHVG